MLGSRGRVVGSRGKVGVVGVMEIGVVQVKG